MPVIPLERRDLDDYRVLWDPPSLPTTRENGDVLVNGVDGIRVIDTVNHTITELVWWGSWIQQSQVSIATLATLGRATETDVARAFAVIKDQTIQLGRATETDVARAFTASKAVALGRATETDVARAFTVAGAPQTVALGRATEVDVARAFTVAGVADYLTDADGNRLTDADGNNLTVE